MLTAVGFILYPGDPCVPPWRPQRGAQMAQMRGLSPSMGSFASGPAAAEAAAGGSRLGGLGAAIGLGTVKNPIHMMQARATATASCS